MRHFLSRRYAHEFEGKAESLPANEGALSPPCQTGEDWRSTRAFDNSMVVLEVTLRIYDEQALVDRLTTLDRRSKTAFAASCAQFLLPLFERYARSAGAPEMRVRLEAIVAAAWTAASGVETDVRGHQDEAEAMVPSVDDGWTLDTGYGQNAAAAAAYAIRTWLTDDPQEAAWAARQVYEVADYAVLASSPRLDVNASDIESRVLASDIVQMVLTTLDRAVEVVASAPPTWEELRAASEADGRAWAGAMP